MSGILTGEKSASQDAADARLQEIVDKRLQNAAEAQSDAIQNKGKADEILSIVSQVAVFVFFQGVYVHHSYADIECLLAIVGMALSILFSLSVKVSKWLAIAPLAILLVLLFSMLLYTAITSHIDSLQSICYDVHPFFCRDVRCEM